MVAGPVSWSVLIIIEAFLVPRGDRSRLIKIIAPEISDCPWIQPATFAKAKTSLYVFGTVATKPSE
jgi:hypothetical protein